MLEIEVCQIKGKCPVHKVGDTIVIDDPKILLDKTDALCVHALYVADSSSYPDKTKVKVKL